MTFFLKVPSEEQGNKIRNHFLKRPRISVVLNGLKVAAAKLQPSQAAAAFDDPMSLTLKSMEGS